MWHLILSLALAALFAATGAGKVLGLAFATRNRDELGVNPTFWRATGLLEWAGAAGLVAGLRVAPLGVAAASGLALLMVGAIVVRVRAAVDSGLPLREVHGLDRAVSGDVIVLALAVVDAVLIVRGF